VDAILERSTSQQSKFFALQVRRERREREQDPPSLSLEP